MAAPGPWLVAAVLLLLSAAAVFLRTVEAAWLAPPDWWAAFALPAGAVLAARGTVLLRRSHAWRRRLPAREEIHVSCDTGPGGRLPTVGRRTDPLTWGVAPAAADARDGASLPPYVPRAADVRLRAAVQAQKFVLLTGDSAVGKTRSAHEAVRHLTDHVLIAPRPGARVAPALQAAAAHPRCVLWLDDLHRWASDPQLTAQNVGNLLGGQGRGTHRVVVATLRDTEKKRLLDGDDAERWRLLLRRAVEIRVDRVLTDGERKRAERFRSDERIAHALDRRSVHGFAPLLARAPELLAEVKGAGDPSEAGEAETAAHALSPASQGALLVAAAVTVRRCGAVGPIPRALVERLHVRLSEEAGSGDRRPETPDRAWEWATEPRAGTTRLLTPVGTDHVEVFDHLVEEALKRTLPGERIPDALFDEVLEGVSAEDAMVLGWEALRFGRDGAAVAGMRRSVRLRAAGRGPDHPDTLETRHRLARTLMTMGEPDASLAEYREVAAGYRRLRGKHHPATLRSRHQLAFALLWADRLEEAEAEQRSVAQTMLWVLGPQAPEIEEARQRLSVLERRIRETRELNAELDW